MPDIKFGSLPPSIKQRLLERQAGNGGVAIPTVRKYTWLWLIAISSTWLVLLVILSAIFRWNSTNLVIFGVVTTAAVFCLIRGVQDFKRSTRSQNCLVVTPHYLIEFHDDLVHYQSIENLVTVNSSHTYEAGNYKRTQINLTLEGGTRLVYVYDPDLAEDVVDQIGLFRKQFLEASARGDTRYFETHDDFREMAGTRQTDEKMPAFRVPYKSALTALTVGMGLMAATGYANEYFDDVRSWNRAKDADRASAYRSYLSAHSDGRWSPNAAERLQGLYDNAESKYRSSLNEGYDENAADALLAILRYAKETGNYRVEVIFERHVDVPETLIEEIKSEFDVKKVLPLDDAFSREKMLRRETALLDVLREAFKQIFPEDILELTYDCTDGCAQFLVTYETTFKDSVYYDTKEKDLPEADRTYNPGILINWKFAVRLPSQNEPYEFELESVPAETITYDAGVSETNLAQPDVDKIERNNFYDAMVNSSFQDFREHLVFRMGIGPPPKDSVESEGGTTASDRTTLKRGDRPETGK